MALKSLHVILHLRLVYVVGVHEFLDFSPALSQHLLLAPSRSEV